MDDWYNNEQKSAEDIHQILSVINYIHKAGIVHRDITPENILLDTKGENAILKLVDFGSATYFTKGQNLTPKETYGTVYYIAPEVLGNNYNEKCDIWSVGVILFILLSGSPPFNGENDNAIKDNVKKGEYKMEDGWELVSTEAKSFIKKLLQKDLSLRYSAEEALQDPWLIHNRTKSNLNLPNLTFSLDNLKNFRAGKKLQEATLQFIINYMASKE